MKLFKRKLKLTEYHTIDYIKTDEQLDAYVQAYTEELQEENKRYEKALMKIATGNSLKKTEMINLACVALNPALGEKYVHNIKR